MFAAAEDGGAGAKIEFAEFEGSAVAVEALLFEQGSNIFPREQRECEPEAKAEPSHSRYPIIYWRRCRAVGNGVGNGDWQVVAAADERGKGFLLGWLPVDEEDELQPFGDRPHPGE